MLHSSRTQKNEHASFQNSNQDRFESMFGNDSCCVFFFFFLLAAEFPRKFLFSDWFCSHWLSASFSGVHSPSHPHQRPPPSTPPHPRTFLQASLRPQYLCSHRIRLLFKPQDFSFLLSYAFSETLGQLFLTCFCPADYDSSCE